MSRRPLLALFVLAACHKDARPPSLDEAISVEQPGGTASQIFSQGSELPTSATESFTTGKDGERRLAIHVLRGAARSARRLTGEGWWSIDGVTPAKAGEARVLVTFELDAQGALSLSAREDDRRLPAKPLASGAEAKLAPAPLTEPDDDEDVEDDSR